MDEQMNIELLSKIAWLYYYEDQSQQQISDALGIPRIKVVRLLKVIREKKIVEIKIRRKYISLFETEKQFKETTGLDDVTVVPGGTNPASNIGYAASLRLGELCKKYESIGIGASRAISSTLAQLEVLKPKKVKRLISLTGNTMPNYALNPASNFCSRAIMVAQLLDIDFFNIWAPAIASTNEAALALRNDYMMKSILEMANSVDCAMIGLGDVKDTVLLPHGFIGKDDLAALKANGAVGDVFTHFFDIDGNIIHTSIEKRSMTADVPMKCPVIAVAYGENKVQPIIGAIRGHFVTGIVTDENTASAVIDAMRAKQGK